MSEDSNDSVELSNGNIDNQPDILQADDISLVANGLSDENEEPYLKITEEPQSRGFRFRYKCEGGSHGGLQGVKSERGKKTFPTVQLFNYNGPARIVVSLVTDEEIPKAHAHDLVGKNCQDGVCVVELKKGPHLTATFPNLGVQHVTRKSLVNVLEERVKESVRLQKAMKEGHIERRHEITTTDNENVNIRKQAEDQAKSMSLNVARLCFQAYLLDDNGQFSRLLPSVVSKAIYDCKSPGAAALKICRMDKHSGCVTGNEEVFLLCDKVQKDDIQVRFYEEDDEGKVKWENFGNFGPADVHRQYAIVFKTPPYWNEQIDKQVSVKIQLRRRSDNECSESKPFTYYPQQHDKEAIGRKRKKPMWGGPPPFGNSGGGGESSDRTNFNFGGSDSAFSGFGNQSGSQGSKSGSGGTTRLTQHSPTHTNVVVAQHNQINNYHSMASLHYVVNSTAQGQGQPSAVPGHVVPAAPGHVVQQPSVNQSSPLQSVNGLSTRVEEDSAPAQETKAFQSAEPTILKHKNSPTVLHQTQDTMTNTKQVEQTLETENQNLRQSEMAVHIAGRLAQAVQEYAISGDVRRLLAMQRHLLTVQDDNGDSSLHLAVIHCQPEACRNLLGTILSLSDPSNIVNQYNSLSQTPLHLATLTRQPYMIDLLMRSGANPLLPDRAGNTACHLVAESGDDRCLETLLKFTRPETSEFLPYPELAVRNYQGHTPIHLAILNDNVECLKAMTSVECDVNIQDGTSGNSPLHLAVLQESLTMAGHLILEVGADVNQQRYDGNTPLHLAVSQQNLGLVALLIAAGGDPDVENYEIIGEVDSDSEDEIEPMRDEEIDTYGHTPYHLSSDIKVIRVLNGESYANVCSQSKDPDKGTTNTSYKSISYPYTQITGKGDMQTIDYMERVSIAKLLDNDPQQGWMTLAEYLDLGSLICAFQIQKSPTISLLDNYEALDGTVAKLKDALLKMNRKDVLQEIDQYCKEIDQYLDEKPSPQKVQKGKLVSRGPQDNVSEDELDKKPTVSGTAGDKNNSLDDLESGIESLGPSCSENVNMVEAH